MADNMWYHVFFESIDEGDGYFLGSFKDKDFARKMGDHVEDLIYCDKAEIDKKQELREISRSWIKYKIFPETEFTSMVAFRGVTSFSGFFTFYSIESNKPDFVYKYIELRGTTQMDLFPKQPYEYCVMFHYELKRQIAQKKLMRRHKVPESRYFIIINLENLPSDDFHKIRKFFGEKIEVTQIFFDRMEYTDFISLNINDENIKNEIVDFDYYFDNDIINDFVLKARCYDEKSNILYFNLVGIK